MIRRDINEYNVSTNKRKKGRKEGEKNRTQLIFVAASARVLLLFMAAEGY